MNDTSYKISFSIQTFEAEVSGDLDFRPDFGSKRSTSFDLDITSTTANKIKTVVFRFMAIASYWGAFTAYTMQRSYSFTYVSSSSSISISSFFLDYVNITGDYKTFSVLIGFDVSPSSSITNELSLKIDIYRTSTTSIAGSLTSDSTSSIKVRKIIFSEITVNFG